MKFSVECFGGKFNGFGHEVEESEEIPEQIAFVDLDTDEKIVYTLDEVWEQRVLNGSEAELHAFYLVDEEHNDRPNQSESESTDGK